MNKNTLSKIIMAASVMVALNLLGGSQAKAQESDSCGVDPINIVASEPKDYETLKQELGELTEKVKESSRDNLSVLFVLFKIMREEIAAAELTEKQAEELKAAFNSMIDIAKSLD